MSGGQNTFIFKQKQAIIMSKQNLFLDLTEKLLSVWFPVVAGKSNLYARTTQVVTWVLHNAFYSPLPKAVFHGDE